MIRQFGLLILLSLLLPAAKPMPNQAIEEEEILANAHQRALMALKKLGPQRGGLNIRGQCLKILGVVSGLKSDMVVMKKNLRELGAKVSDSEIHIALSGDVLFDFDKWIIRKDAETMLHKVLSVITGSKSSQVLITGHTDSIGDEVYNRDLSLKRARAVRDWLVKNGAVDARLFTLKGCGESEPAAPNTHPDGSDNPQGRQKNRRVELSIQTITGKRP